MRRLLFSGMLALAACAKAPQTDRLAGYIESDLVYVAAEESGRIVDIGPVEGAAVAAGAPLFRLDAEKMTLSLNRAEAEAAAARQRAQAGGALAEAENEAAASAEAARKAFARIEALRRDGFATAARGDEARATRDAAFARLDRARAERAAAQKQADAADAEVLLLRRRLDDMTIAAPAAGTVERIYRRPGEVVGAGETVVALRPPAAVKLRFFAPQAALSRTPVGSKIGWSCDGCKGPLFATVVYVAADPQFTPPIIYSREERDALVFLVEARPDPGAPRLAEGQPVDIDLP